MPEIDQFGVPCVRAKDKATRHEHTIPASWLVTEPGAWEQVSKPALNADGTRLPVKHYVAPESLSSQSKTGQKADAQKGNS